MTLATLKVYQTGEGVNRVCVTHSGSGYSTDGSWAARSWSAHLFLCWCRPAGPYRSHTDGDTHTLTQAVNHPLIQQTFLCV